ncbi:hypothetical protein [Vibrio fluvialis]|uniref:hypothetical protein n=1 Tax=Vibrio fluvialis TaxID=676 RepID=UPI000C225D2E|nr:hypothetical protein [Vibrio fluvialis]MBL4240374.1 hypothetical protein [Vibrio fluvialis]MBL4266463.1 hypothetical protein [Vibrio fluvialis]MBL4271071.1 hypothetical protein [Vibrio fluvialis]MBO1442499.1 hypothetical protein [Vibrio fluvialis]MBO1446801.1 hypothetical protein [Vibrio fluvialis]
MNWRLILSSISNEIQIEKYFYKINNFKPSDYNYLPRIVKLKDKKYIDLVKSISFFIRLSWPFVLAPIYYFVSFLASCCRFVLCWDGESVKKLKSECDSVFSASGEGSFIKARKFIKPKKTIILGEFSESFKNQNSGFNFVSIYQVIKFYDLIHIFVISIYYNFKLLVDPSTSRWVMQGYTIFEILLRYKALYRIEKNIIIVDHFDRWAVLTDEVVSELKNEKKLEIKLTIIQHGILTNDYSNFDSNLPFNLTTRLNNVTDLIVYDELSKRIFLEKILSNDRCCFSISPPVLNMECTESENIKLLFVGHSICLKFHVDVYLFLRHVHPEIDFYYKPHPLQTIDHLTLNLGWKVYDKPDCFPDVDVVVSYPSTLAYEYHLTGKLVIQHNIYDNAVTNSSIINQISKELKKRATSC